MKRKFLSTLVCLTIVLLAVLLLPNKASAAAETVASGTCGDNLIWTLDEEGTLTLSGNGNMDDFLNGRYAPWYYKKSQIKAVVIGDSITSIGNYAFYYCNNLTSIAIPNNVTTIGNYAFYNCGNLTRLAIGDNVTKIGDYAFSCCYSLTSITIPDTVTDIGSSAFWSCSSLQNVTIGNSVSKIASYAFQDCTSLTIITIPDGVTGIDFGVFQGCSALTSITIPDSITVIDFAAFFNCSSLSHVAYTGTQSQWSAIKVYPSNTKLTNATLHYETRFQTIDNCVETGVYCPVCESFIVRAEKNAHNYGEWVVTKPATLTIAGQKMQTCISCGNTNVESIDMLVGKVYEWNITLEDDYAVNFYLQISEIIHNTAKVQLTIGDNTVTSNLSELQQSKDGYFQLTANISAAQMNDIITVMVINGSEIGCNDTYTAREYCDKILDSPEYSTYHTLVREMLNYGAMAQIYFDHNVEHLANVDIYNTSKAVVPATAEEMTVSDKIGNLNFYGASLVYRDRIAVRYYFTGDIAGCTFIANGNTYTPVAKDRMYYIEIPDILPQNIDQQIVLTVTNRSGDTIQISYNPMNYIVRMNAKGSENLQNLLKSLYNYHLAAKQYINSKHETGYESIYSGVWKMLSYADGRLYDVTIDFRTSNNSVPSIMVGYGDDITDELQQWLNWGAPLTEWNGRYYYFGSGDGGEITYTISNNIISLSYESILSLTLKRTSGNQFTILSASAERELIANGFTVGNIFTWSTE